jgi:hypothetical protein
MDFVSPGQRVKKGTASLDPPFSDQAAERKEGHSSGRVYLQGWRNIDLPFGIQFVDAFHGGFGLDGCTSRE